MYMEEAWSLKAGKNNRMGPPVVVAFSCLISGGKKMVYGRYNELVN